MNKYLEQLFCRLAITSIGLDGEEIDQVTSMEKPQIYVKPGYIVATAFDTLKNYSCKYKILEKTELITSIGEVVIIEILDEGKALVAGPSKVKDMQKLTNILEKYKLEKIIIDGAFSRQAFAKAADATIFVVGANKDKNIDNVVKDAFLQYRKFTLKTLPLKPYSFGENISFIDREGNFEELSFSSVIGNVNDIFVDEVLKAKFLYIPKTITNKFVEKLIVERGKYVFDLIIDSPINIQLKDENLEKLFKLNFNIFVLNPVNLALVCYNPYSPRGYDFDNMEFKSKLETALETEVINALEGDTNE
ncbi:MAG: hypothetical protein RBQ64_02160 [Candidatus Izemoplasmatales bacterium]|jgi:hypothetical protein|nr:hypothetical protein [Candidatus Izemoplasmatales bacterium]